MNNRTRVREFVEALLRQKGDVGNFGDGDGLISGGRLMSVDAVELVFFLEETFGIDFAEQGFDLNNLDSIEDILALIGSRTPIA